MTAVRKVVGILKNAIQLIVLMLITVAAGAFVTGAYQMPIVIRIICAGWISIMVLLVLTYWTGKELGVKSKILLIGQVDSEKQIAGD